MNTTKIIIKVERTPCAYLKDMRRTAVDMVTVPDGINWEEIPTRRHPSLSISEKEDDKVHMYTATLKFYTCMNFTDRKYYAYRVTLAGGARRIIGSYDRPFPVLTIQESMPEKPSDNFWNEVTITWATPTKVPYMAG